MNCNSEKTQKTLLERYFDDEIIQIKVYYEHFPHLIGVRKPKGQHNFIDTFLEDLFYQTNNVIDDFTANGADKDKLKTFPWIKLTLLTPNYILERNALSQTMDYDADLTFIKVIKRNADYSHHIVGLHRISSSEYVIKSQFPIRKKDKSFRKRFKLKNAIYFRKKQNKS